MERFQLRADDARQLADEFGTPLYVLDEGTFRRRIQHYRSAFHAVAPNFEISYASKANGTFALLKIAHQEGCRIDVASEGELRAALLAGIPAADCAFHGNNKQRSELEFALENKIGHLMVDNFEEIDFLAEQALPPETSIFLRLAPGVKPETNEKISTGQSDTKFGFNLGNGSARKAVQTCLDKGLPLKGLHCHVGSQLLDPTAQKEGALALAEFAIQLKSELEFSVQAINFGGGLGVDYGNGAPFDFESFNREVILPAREKLLSAGLDPQLCQEPGRSLVAECGVTLYTIGVRKEVPVQGGEKIYLSVDGGLSDNPRPALYNSIYPVQVLGKGSESLAAFSVSGRHCETDLLFDKIELAASAGPGDLLQVLCTGAYNSSMASNYNRFLRPATVMRMQSGETVVVQRRETWQDLFARDVAVPIGKPENGF